MPRTDLLHVLLRRWYVVIVFLLVTGGLAVGATKLVPPTYSARSSVLLLPPTSPDATNPYLGLGDLQPVASTLARSVLNDAAVATLAKKGVTGGYSVTIDPNSSAPILLVTAKAKTAAGAVHAMNDVTALLPPTLLSLQQGTTATPRDYVTSRILIRDAKASTVRKSQTRALLVATVFGLVLTGIAAVGVDRFLLRRRSRSGESRSAVAEVERPAVTAAGAPAGRARARSRALPGPDRLVVRPTRRRGERAAEGDGSHEHAAASNGEAKDGRHADDMVGQTEVVAAPPRQP